MQSRIVGTTLPVLEFMPCRPPLHKLPSSSDMSFVTVVLLAGKPSAGAFAQNQPERPSAMVAADTHSKLPTITSSSK